MEQFTDALRLLLSSSGSPVTDGQLDRLSAFYALLEEANRSMNLIAECTATEAAERHFLDSLAPPALALLKPGDSLIDVGTGAGFPGVPLAIMRADLTVILLDSMKKRTDFLSTATAALGLKNITIVTVRAEDYARGAGRERFDATLSRAVASMNVLLEYTLPFLRIGGRALAWKGPSAAQEVNEAARACRVLGGDQPRLHPYALPGRPEFCIVETEKIRPTPTKYPRKAGKPTSEPLI